MRGADLATTRQAQKEATRARIVEAAKTLFEMEGYAATTLRGVAKAANVAVGTVFVHFGDKRDLLHSALFEDLEATAQEALASLPEAGPIEGVTHHLAARYLAYYQARPELSRVLLAESLLAEPPWQGRFAAQVGTIHQALSARFEAARAAGEVAEDADGALFGVAFFSFYYFALISWAQGAHPDPLGLVDRLIAQHLAGLRPGR